MTMRGIACVGGVLLTVMGVSPAVAQPYDLSWHTIDGGGGTSTGGGYELTGTIGQPDATGPNALSGGSYQLTGGFWVIPPLTCASYAPVDFDHDCDVDGADLLTFQSCLSGPEIPHNGTPLCAGVDLDGDGDLDQADYARFQGCYSGAELAADPDCAN